MTLPVAVVDFLVSIVSCYAVVFAGLRLLGLRIPRERLVASGLFFGLLIGIWTQVNHALGVSFELHFLIGMVLEVLVLRFVARVPVGLAFGVTMAGWVLFFVSAFLMFGLARWINLDFAVVKASPVLYFTVGFIESSVPIAAALLLWRRSFVLVDFSKTSPTSGRTLWLFDVFLAQTLGLVMLGFLSAIKHVPLWQAFPVGLPGLLVFSVTAGLPIISIMVIRQLNRLYQAEFDLREAERLAMVGRLTATLAHEVRNPVGVIKGYLQLAQQMLSQVTSLRHPILVEAVTNASHEVRHVENLLTDFLILGKPAEDKIEPIETEALLREIVEGAAQVAGARQVEVTTDAPASLPRIQGSRKRLHQLVANLLKNAIESCPPGGSVRIGATISDEGDELTLTVADTGVGIPPENLPRIFEPFFTTKEEGTGLGLSVVKKIVDDWGGALDVKSEPGKGTQFTIRLPVQTGSGLSTA